jgi:hypothetical protein
MRSERAARLIPTSSISKNRLVEVTRLASQPICRSSRQDLQSLQKRVIERPAAHSSRVGRSPGAGAQASKTRRTGGAANRQHETVLRTLPNRSSPGGSRSPMPRTGWESPAARCATGGGGCEQVVRPARHVGVRRATHLAKFARKFSPFCRTPGLSSACLRCVPYSHR